MSIYAHLWGTDETRALFDDDGRTRMWLEILGALVEAQGELSLIPASAAAEIAARVRDPVDLAAVANETRTTGHSTLGLIRVLQRDLSGDARQWVYYGATVQDVSDTWTGLVARRMLDIAERELGAIDAALARLAAEHRDTVMLGARTGSQGCRSRSASRPQSGWPRCAGTASAWRRPCRGWRSGSSRARWGRCRRGAPMGRSSSGWCSSDSASACRRSRGRPRVTALPSW